MAAIRACALGNSYGAQRLKSKGTAAKLIGSLANTTIKCALEVFEHFVVDAV
jgi:hypothetical protein